MSEIWYKATRYSIQSIEVERATDSNVFFMGGRREAIDSKGCHWRKTRKEAINAILGEIDSDIQRELSTLEFYRRNRAEVEARLKEEQ